MPVFVFRNNLLMCSYITTKPKIAIHYVPHYSRSTSLRLPSWYAEAPASVLFSSLNPIHMTTKAARETRTGYDGRHYRIVIVLLSTVLFNGDCKSIFNYSNERNMIFSSH